MPLWNADLLPSYPKKTQPFSGLEQIEKDTTMLLSEILLTKPATGNINIDIVVIFPCFNILISQRIHYSYEFLFAGLSITQNKESMIW